MCVPARKPSSPLTQPTQVSTQVQLAFTCHYLLVRLARALGRVLFFGLSISHIPIIFGLNLLLIPYDSFYTMPQPVRTQESHSTFHSIIYLSQQRSCLTTFPNTEKRVENMIRSRVFLMNLELFENVVKHCLEHFDISFKSFSQHAQFWKLGNILGYSPVWAGEYLVKWLV